MVSESASRKTFVVFNDILMLFIGLSTVFPFLYMTFVSIIPQSQFKQVGLSWPRYVSLEVYGLFFAKGSLVLNAYVITIIMTVLTTVFSVLITALAAYTLSKKEIPGRNAMNFMIFFTMLFGGGLIPWYLVVKSLGLVNNIWALIIPFLCSPMNIFIMRSFFSNLPREMEESAYIDGASEIRVMFTIILPLSIPVIATVALFVAVGQWNEFFNASFLISDQKLFPLQLALRKILLNTDTALAAAANTTGQKFKPPPGELVRSSAVMLSTLPILITYPFVQKYFVKGVMLGSLKG
jgi:putative aldouronate transport system permease protein